MFANVHTYTLNAADRLSCCFLANWDKMEAGFSSLMSVEGGSCYELDGVQPWGTFLPTELCFSRAVNLLVVFQYFHHVVVLKLQGVIHRQVAPPAQDGVAHGANWHKLAEGESPGPHGSVYETMNNMMHKLKRCASKMLFNMLVLVYYFKVRLSV